MASPELNFPTQHLKAPLVLAFSTGLDIAYHSLQAFSHFTFERSGHQLSVVDIQGVGDLYTDPQIHTESGTGFGDGNLGKSSLTFS